jgi:hypothetical protein
LYFWHLRSSGLRVAARRQRAAPHLNCAADRQRAARYSPDHSGRIEDLLSNYDEPLKSPLSTWGAKPTQAPLNSPLTSWSPSNLAVWGSDDNNQISGQPQHGPFALIAPGGATQLLALRSDGTPHLWGGVAAGSKGLIVDAARVAASAQAHEKYDDLAISISFAAGLRNDDKSIQQWGGPSMPYTYLGKQFAALTVGGGQVVAIDTDGLLAQWGDGEGTQPKPAGVKFRKVQSRNDYNFALSDALDLYGWGGNLFQYPPLFSEKLPEPWRYVHQPQPDGSDYGYWFCPGPFSDIAAGVKSAVTLSHPSQRAHVLAVDANTSRVRGWGGNQFGQRKAPDIEFIRVAAGKGFSVGLTVDGEVRVWPPNGPPDHPALGNPPVGKFAGIIAGTAHAAAWHPIYA